MARYDHLDILQALLRAGAELTGPEVQSRLGLSERQARRVLGDLHAAGPPLAVRRDGKARLYSYAPADRALLAAPVPLTEAEALALVLAAQAARPTLAPTPLADALRSAVAKLVPPADVVTFEPDEAAAQFVVGDAVAAPIAADVFEAVRRAVQERRRLTFRYTNTAGKASWGRDVRPYALAVVRGSWLLVGHDAYRGAVAHFSLPDVTDVEVGEPYGAVPSGFDAEQHLRDAFGAFTGGEVETVRLRVGPSAAASFRRKRYHPTQLVEAAHADGGVTVSFEAALAPDLAAFVRSFGPAVCVEAPATLAAAVAADARATAALYAASGPSSAA